MPDTQTGLDQGSGRALIVLASSLSGRHVKSKEARLHHSISSMAAIGSLVFCTDCGNLLDGSIGNRKRTLHCQVCGTKNQDTADTTVTTTSKPSAFPSILRQKRSDVQTLTEDDVRKGAVIDQQCPECKGRRTRYYTQQLRSADEGETVFYTCEDCGHK